MVRSTRWTILAVGMLAACVLPVEASPAGAPAGALRAGPGFGIAARAPLASVATSDAAPAALRSALAMGDAAQSSPAGPARSSVRATRLKAIGASLLLPGLGHRVSGHDGRGTVFMAAEAAILLGIVVSEAQGYIRKQGYIDYAETFAGIADASGQPDWYYRNLGQYRSSEEYVDDIARTARALYGDDLAGRDDYIARNRPAAGREWSWRSDAERREFRDRRKESRNAFRMASLFLGGALLNRLVSGADAARLASRPKLSAGVKPGGGAHGDPWFVLAVSLP